MPSSLLLDQSYANRLAIASRSPPASVGAPQIRSLTVASRGSSSTRDRSPAVISGIHSASGRQMRAGGAPFRATAPGAGNEAGAAIRPTQAAMVAKTAKRMAISNKRVQSRAVAPDVGSVVTGCGKQARAPGHDTGGRLQNIWVCR